MSGTAEAVQVDHRNNAGSGVAAAVGRSECSQAVIRNVNYSSTGSISHDIHKHNFFFLLPPTFATELECAEVYGAG